MSNLVQIGVDYCGGLGPIVGIIKKGFMPLVQIAIPIILIVYGVIDLGKSVIASDEKEIKAAQSRLIKRCIYAAAIFLVVFFVTIVMNLVAAAKDDTNSIDTTSWQKCWNSI